MIHEMEQKIRRALLSDIDTWVDATLFGDNPKYLHVIVVGDDEQMLLVAKQMALLAHFPSFDEKNSQTCTRISILGKIGANESWKDVFGNLLKWQKNKWIDVLLDVEVEHIGLFKDEGDINDETNNACVKNWIVEHESSNLLPIVYDANRIAMLIASNKVQYTDKQMEQMAIRANMVYEASRKFEIIHANDVDNIREYRKPVEDFLNIAENKALSQWQSLSELNKLSNYCLVDSILVRVRSLQLMGVNRSCFFRKKSLYKILAENLVEMSQSEHARWNVEKLINGFRPFTHEEVMKDNILLGTERKEYELSLKKDPASFAHVDLCSYNRLCRMDLNAVKYDSFLLLAMVKYWEKYC